MEFCLSISWIPQVNLVLPDSYFLVAARWCPPLSYSLTCRGGVSTAMTVNASQCFAVVWTDQAIPVLCFLGKGEEGNLITVIKSRSAQPSLWNLPPSLLEHFGFFLFCLCCVHIPSLSSAGVLKQGTVKKKKILCQSHLLCHSVS